MGAVDFPYGPARSFGPEWRTTPSADEREPATPEPRRWSCQWSLPPRIVNEWGKWAPSFKNTFVLDGPGVLAFQASPEWDCKRKNQQFCHLTNPFADHFFSNSGLIRFLRNGFLSSVWISAVCSFRYAAFCVFTRETYGSFIITNLMAMQPGCNLCECQQCFQLTKKVFDNRPPISGSRETRLSSPWISLHFLSTNLTMFFENELLRNDF